MNISMPESQQAGNEIFTVNVDDFLFGKCQLRFQVGLLPFEFDKPVAGRFSDNAHLNGFHHVRDRRLHSREIVFNRVNLELSVLVLPVSNSLVGDPLDCVICQTILLDGLCHRWLDNIPADILLVAGMADTSILTGVVMMHIPGL